MDKQGQEKLTHLQEQLQEKGLIPLAVKNILDQNISGNYQFWKYIMTRHMIFFILLN